MPHWKNLNSGQWSGQTHKGDNRNETRPLNLDRSISTNNINNNSTFHQTTSHPGLPGSTLHQEYPKPATKTLHHNKIQINVTAHIHSQLIKHYLETKENLSQSSSETYKMQLNLWDSNLQQYRRVHIINTLLMFIHIQANVNYPNIVRITYIIHCL